MNSRRSLLLGALATILVAGTATTARADTTGLLALPFFETAVRGKTVRFFVKMTVDGQSAPAGICLAIQQRLGSPTAAPCTIALCPTDCAGWAFFDYPVPTDPTKTKIYLSAYYSGHKGAGIPLTACQSVPQLVPFGYGRQPV